MLEPPLSYIGLRLTWNLMEEAHLLLHLLLLDQLMAQQLLKDQPTLLASMNGLLMLIVMIKTITMNANLMEVIVVKKTQKKVGTIIAMNVHALKCLRQPKLQLSVPSLIG